MINNQLKVIECPRDAMQGIQTFIPTKSKIDYLNKLLLCGFDTLDFGSFVSPKAIPQLSDTKEVLAGLNLDSTKTKLLAIVANERGAEEASRFDEINYIGFPLSVSEQFQKRNTNKSIDEAFKTLDTIQETCKKLDKTLVVYLSMGFGNPYGEAWGPELVANWCSRLDKQLDVRIMALSDTIGCAKEEDVTYLFKHLIPELPQVEFGAHLHVRPDKAESIIQAAISGGCKRFDGAIKGYGGCPMAKDDLTGNLPTESLLAYCESNNFSTGIDNRAFQEAYTFSSTIF